MFCNCFDLALFFCVCFIARSVFLCEKFLKIHFNKEQIKFLRNQPYIFRIPIEFNRKKERKELHSVNTVFTKLKKKFFAISFWCNMIMTLLESNMLN